MSPRARPIAVAVTGATGAMGRLLLPHLVADPRVGRIVALGLTTPADASPKLTFRPVDLTQASAARDLTQILASERPATLVHLAFFAGQIRDPAYAHEVEAIGTGHLLSACVAARVQHVVMSSTTCVYGASPRNPSVITEDRPLLGNARSRFVSDKVEAEMQVRRWRERHPALKAAVLRLAPTLGAHLDNPFTRYLSLRLAPVVMGFDPLVQLLHEEDGADALALATLQGASGDFNIVPRGLLPLSSVLKLLGIASLPLPLPWARAALTGLQATGMTNTPPSMLDYLRYVFVADGSRAARELGFEPRRSTRDAVLAFAQARRRRRAA